MKERNKLPEKLILYSFSLDGSRIMLSTENLYYILHVDSGKIISRDGQFGGMRLIEWLQRTGLYLLVPSGDLPGTSPRRLKVWNNDSRTIIQEIVDRGMSLE